MQYSRILLKLSGEALSGNGSYGIDDNVLERYAGEIIEAASKGCGIAVVTGGGNIFRGIRGTESGFDRVKGDQMGLTAWHWKALSRGREGRQRSIPQYVWSRLENYITGTVYWKQ